MSESEDYGFKRKVTTKKLASGHEATLQYDDGSAISAWGRTEEEAKTNLLEVNQ